ncbi:methyltransferase domain-containing protein [Gaopeijia maritima]|uniref:Methyltransferase domain-containing protein n=1 Tax=Gaopeijia maritima TaxID=3119007 RepID=A0ABU9EA12_9BACT
MLDLVRLSRRRLFPPGGEALYRQIAVLTGMGEDAEVLDVGCGKAVTLEYFVREFGVHGSGIESDPQLVDEALERLREAELGDRVQVQQAPADSLPYRDAIFDITVGEVGMTADADPAEAVRELVRVTRPGGTVVLVQLVWLAPVEPHRRALLEDHLGVRPRILVEWKRLLREAGVTDLHTEDWSDPDTAFRPGGVKPFPDFAELFSLGEKIGILRRAWARWGWTGVRTVLSREREVHRLLTRERILGLDLLKGTRMPDPDTPEAADAPETADAEAASDGPVRVDVVGDADADAAPDADADAATDADAPRDTRGLPLFTPEGS